MKTIKYFLLVLSFFTLGCRKFLEVDNPRDRVTANYAYNSENSAIAVVTGIYHDIQKNYGQGVNGVSINCGAASDELTAIVGSGPHVYYVNNGGEGLWGGLYADIYKCNAAIEGLEKSDKISHIVRDQLLGEVKFTRAFLYFYLVNLFGDVPLLTTSNYAENSKLSRSNASKVYEQIKTDLQEAINLLNVNYVGVDVRTSTSERVRPNKATAQALLARVYLYTNDWSNAELIAGLLINNATYKLSNDLDVVFQKNSSEAIWQLQPQSIDINGSLLENCADARYFVLNDFPNDRDCPVWMSSYLESIFEPGDLRYEEWVGKTDFRDDQNIPLATQYHYPYKYKRNEIGQSQEEYIMVFRIAEQYLIRAEARINNGKVAEGIADLNLLRSNRSIGIPGASDGLQILSTTISSDQAKLLVEHERQVELFTEWGHRWLDLKRTARIDAVMSNLSPAKSEVAWQSFKQYFPTPAEDRRLNENLGQTPGWPQ